MNSGTNMFARDGKSNLIFLTNPFVHKSHGSEKDIDLFKCPCNRIGPFVPPHNGQVSSW